MSGWEDEVGVNSSRDLFRSNIDGDGVSNFKGWATSSCKSGESLEWERWVARGAGSDELRGQRVYFVEVKWDVKRRWIWYQSCRISEICGVAGFDSQDTSGVREVHLIDDVGSGSEVGGDTDTFEDVCDCDKGLDVGVGEAVGAFRHWGGTGSGDTIGEELDVGHLIRGDSVNSGPESGDIGFKVGFVKLGDTLVVEVILQVLERQSVVEDLSIGSELAFCRGSGRKTSKSKEQHRVIREE